MGARFCRGLVLFCCPCACLGAVAAHPVISWLPPLLARGRNHKSSLFLVRPWFSDFAQLLPFSFFFAAVWCVCRCKVAKNKIAPPFRVVEMDILFGTGIDTVSCLLDAAEDAGFFTRKGSWYSYEGKNISQVRCRQICYCCTCGFNVQQTIVSFIFVTLKNTSENKIIYWVKESNGSISCNPQRFSQPLLFGFSVFVSNNQNSLGGKQVCCLCVCLVERFWHE